MLPHEIINDRGVRCHKCEAKIPKGEKMLYFGKSAWNGNLGTGQICQKCTLKLAAKVCGTKVFTRKVIAYIMSEEV